MSYQISPSLAFALIDGTLTGYNFLRKLSFECEPALFEVLQDLSQRPQQSDFSDAELAPLVESGVLVEPETTESAIEDEFRSVWKWGLPAALFHFSVQGNSYLTAEEMEAKQIAAALLEPSPPLHMTNEKFSASISLPKADTSQGLMGIMAARRTVREFDDGPVSLGTVSDLLFSGMGITGQTENVVCDLPLSMTPSGGARNPYEAYLIAQNIDELDAGVYHYSAMDHSLGKLESRVPEHLSDLACGQGWIDRASCLIVLCAFMERTMWKYDDPNAYRVVMIEAGHIGQNMMLAGTALRLTVCPTAALNHTALHRLLDLPSQITCAPIYAFAVGRLTT